MPARWRSVRVLRPGLDASLGGEAVDDALSGAAGRLAISGLTPPAPIGCQAC